MRTYQFVADATIYGGVEAENLQDAQKRIQDYLDSTPMSHDFGVYAHETSFTSLIDIHEDEE